MCKPYFVTLHCGRWRIRSGGSSTKLPHNAFLQAKDLDLPGSAASCPRKGLYQLLMGLYGEWACMVNMFCGNVCHHPYTSTSRFCARQSCTHRQIIRWCPRLCCSALHTPQISKIQPELCARANHSSRDRWFICPCWEAPLPPRRGVWGGGIAFRSPGGGWLSQRRWGLTSP